MMQQRMQDERRDIFLHGVVIVLYDLSRGVVCMKKIWTIVIAVLAALFLLSGCGEVTLEEKMELWVYLNDLAEQIEAQKK